MQHCQALPSSLASPSEQASAAQDFEVAMGGSPCIPALAAAVIAAGGIKPTVDAGAWRPASSPDIRRCCTPRRLTVCPRSAHPNSGSSNHFEHRGCDEMPRLRPVKAFDDRIVLRRLGAILWRRMPLVEAIKCGAEAQRSASHADAAGSRRAHCLGYCPAFVSLLLLLLNPNSPQHELVSCSPRALNIISNATKRLQRRTPG